MTIFASYTNTSAILCWFYIMLCDNPSWLAKIRVEIDSFMKTHSIKGSSLTDALADIPLDTWEPSLPTLDLCLHECLRLIMNGSIIRRNIGRDVQISGRTIRSGDFLMYMTADAHLDGEMYPEPLKFDPLRDQNKSGRLGFLAWGAGEFARSPICFAQTECTICRNTSLHGSTSRKADNQDILCHAALHFRH